MISPIDTGQKSSVAAMVRNIMPPHKVWCEPYFRMGEVFFRKLPSAKEIINDADNNVVNFYLMVRNRWEQLYFLMESTLHCDFFVKLADSLLDNEKTEELYRAWAFWLKCQKAFVTPERWQVTDVLPTDNIQQTDIQKRTLRMLSVRLADTFIANRNPLEVIKDADGPDTLFYLCPPDKKALASLEQVLNHLKGKVILHTSESYLMKRMMTRLDIYTDDDCLPLGLYTNFKRQHTLFE